MQNTTGSGAQVQSVIENEQGKVVAIVTDIRDAQGSDQTNDKAEALATTGDAFILNTDANQDIIDAIPPLLADTDASGLANSDQTLKLQDTELHALQQDLPVVQSHIEGQQPNPQQSRWTKANRVTLKELMSSLPPQDIGAALRVILDTFGVQASKLVRRGEYIELDLKQINDDYILDSLWNYCAQMQYNIMTSLQAQQQQAMQHIYNQQSQNVQAQYYPQAQAYMPQQEQLYADNYMMSFPPQQPE